MEITNKQINMLKAAFVSFVIHCLCLTSIAFFMTLTVRQPQTIQILLATLDPAGGGGEMQQMPEEKKRPNQPAKRSPDRQKPSRRIPLSELTPAKIPVPKDQISPDNFPSLNPLSSSALKAAAVQNGSGTGSGGGAGSGAGNYNGPGRGSGSLDGLKNQYLREHFAYIRDLILNNITYPPLAKKVGWQGRVLVSFIIMEDGRVTNIKIVKSSGHAVLDRNVLETIREVQPFPKPPVRAELFIPVNYVLKS
ncbi:MAG: energy transducer TonB [Smithellaceae bacterium]